MSVVSFAVLWKHDFQNGFHFDADHQQNGSPPFIFIGLAFIAYQLSRTCRWRERVKGILLGTAFALWGSEQFLVNNSWLTLMDNIVIGIFLIDLGVIVAEPLFKKGQN